MRAGMVSAGSSSCSASGGGGCGEQGPLGRLCVRVGVGGCGRLAR